jgi:hypothetical protein
LAEFAETGNIRGHDFSGEAPAVGLGRPNEAAESRMTCSIERFISIGVEEAVSPAWKSRAWTHMSVCSSNTERIDADSGMTPLWPWNGLGGNFEVVFLEGYFFRLDISRG